MGADPRARAYGDFRTGRSLRGDPPYGAFPDRGFPHREFPTGIFPMGKCTI